MRISDWSSDVCYSDLKQALLTLLARRELSRGAVGGALEVHVAQAALAALGHQHAVAVARHVADDLVGGDVDDLGTDRDDDGGVLAALAVALLAHAVLAALRAKPLLVAEVDQGVEVLRRLQPHAAAVAAIAAIGPAERDELLAPETDAAVAAVSGSDGDFGFVD